jgi:outer membrane protein assembly factor BamA
LCSFTFEGQAQNYRLQLSGQDKDSFLLLSQMPIHFQSATDGEIALQNAKNELIKKGYFAASIDSVQWSDSIANAFVFLGKKYEWALLMNKNIPQNLLTQFRFDEKKYFNKPIDLKKIESLFNKITQYYENNGYPFCALHLDSLTEQHGKITALLLLEKGPLTKIDSIKINEDANISKSYVLNYLGLKEGMLYDERKIKSINKKLRELNFLEASSPWRIYFTSVKTTLNLYLKNKSANQADVLIGLLPNNSEIGGKFLVTGDIKLGLVNALNKGESIQINWQNLQYKSPRYDIKFLMPYLLKSPIGVTGKFNFYKKDTTFKTINGQLGLLYQLSASDYVKLYYELASSQLVSVNIPNLKFTRALPANADVSYKTIGLETVFQQVDYRLNPRKGY